MAVLLPLLQRFQPVAAIPAFTSALSACLPDTEPSFNLDPVVISGEAEQQYSVTVPAQDAANTYESFLMYIVEQDQPVIVKDIVVTDDSGSTGGADGGSSDGGSSDGSTDGGSTDGSTDGSVAAPAVEMIEGFGGASIEGDTFTFPTGSEVWAGFANLNTDIYPFTFAAGGTITFTARFQPVAVIPMSTSALSACLTRTLSHPLTWIQC